MPHRAPTTERDAQLPSSSRSSEPLASVLERLACAARTGEPVLLRCEHSLEGVMCGVGLAYLAHLDASMVRLDSGPTSQPQLGEAVVRCPNAHEEEALQLARRVYDGLSRAVSAGCGRLRNGACPPACSAACVNKVVYACASDEPAMPEVVHAYTRLAFQRRGAVRELLSHPAVVALDELARRTLNECERTRQFLRFAKLGDGTFFATFEPNANTLPLVSRHFAERMRGDRFCMVDPRHHVAVFHEPRTRRCEAVLIDGPTADELCARDDWHAYEAYVQAMWCEFYHALTLPGRDASARGYDLRAKWIPKRLWSGLPELANEPLS